MALHVMWFFLNKVFLCPNLTTALKVMFFSLVLVHGNCLKLSIQGQPCLLCAAIHSVFFSSFFRVVKTVLDMLGAFRLMCDEFNKHRSSQPDDPVTQISILVGRVSFPYSASHTLTWRTLFRLGATFLRIPSFQHFLVSPPIASVMLPSS